MRRWEVSFSEMACSLGWRRAVIERRVWAEVRIISIAENLWDKLVGWFFVYFVVWRLSFFLHFFMGFPSKTYPVSFPICQANPTKFMSTSACHVITSFILFNRILALWTYLILNNLNPFVFIIFNHFIPILNFSTIQRRMSKISTQSTYCHWALAPNRFHS